MRRKGGGLTQQQHSSHFRFANFWRPSSYKEGASRVLPPNFNRDSDSTPLSTIGLRGTLKGWRVREKKAPSGRLPTLGSTHDFDPPTVYIQPLNHLRSIILTTREGLRDQYKGPL